MHSDTAVCIHMYVCGHSCAAAGRGGQKTTCMNRFSPSIKGVARENSGCQEWQETYLAAQHSHQRMRKFLLNFKLKQKRT